LGARQAKTKYNFKIGGPAIPEMDPVWIKLLFDFCLANNLELDFISWHRYSFDPDDFVKDVYEVNVLLTDPKYQRFQKVEKIITEWGPNSYKDIAYSNMVAASNTVAVMRRLLDKIKFAFAFEIKDGPGQGNYGWGLLSYSAKPKPRYRLFNWLADFQGQRLEVLGEGSNVMGFAVKEGRQVRLLLTNYNPYQPRDESFQAAFASLTGGRYRLLIQELFGEAKEQELEISPGSLVVNLNMPAYSVVRVEITKLKGLEKKPSSGFGQMNNDINAF